MPAYSAGIFIATEKENIMEEKYYLVKIITNDQAENELTIYSYDTIEACQIAYHTSLALYHASEDVVYGVVEILNPIGGVEIKEIIDHTPEPEPEPEPEP